MQIFGHVSVFISIILGLAVVHLLGGLSLILDTRVRTRVYRPHLLWTFNMLLAAVLVWLSSFVLAPLEEISVLHFFNLVAYAVVTYLMSGLLYPVQGSEVTDFREHFGANRRRFYGLGILFTLVDAADGVLEHYQADVPWDVGQFVTLAVWLVVFAWGLRRNDERFDPLVALVFLVGAAGWLVSLIDVGVLAY
jgi:hypothetical protein